MIKPERLKVLSNKKLCEGHHVIAFKSKAIARTAVPGQFVQILTNCHQDPLLPRPFSFLDIRGDQFEILYQVVGRGTQILSQAKPGDEFTVLGPLGNGWDMDVSGKTLLVGGGVGIPPLYHWAKTRLASEGAKEKSNIAVFLGGRDQTLLHCEKEFRKLGVEVQVSTDNGSRGHHGFVTQILENHLKAAKKSGTAASRIYTCGPTPMLKAVSALAEKYAIACKVSVEEPMPCGFNVCLGCAIKVKADNETGYRYAMSCTEGPVFSAEKILW